MLKQSVTLAFFSSSTLTSLGPQPCFPADQWSFPPLCRFVVTRQLRANEKRGTLQALGGAWDPELDGGDPERCVGDVENVWVCARACVL